MRSCATASLGLLLLAGCAAGRNEQPFTTGHSLSITESRPEGFAPWTDAAYPVYRVGPGDKLRVKYLVTQNMDEEVTVTPDGYIGVLAAGQISAAGRSIPDIEREVAQSARKYVAEQPIVVSLQESVSSRVFVGGAVQSPGVVQLTDLKTSSLQAILMTGGFTDEARLGQVAVIRRSGDGPPMLRSVDIRSVVERGNTDDVLLQPGDVIFVPRSSIAEVNLWVDQFINKVVPFQRSFSYTVGTYRTATGGGFVP